MARDTVVIMGIYVADLAFGARRMPVVGETVLGSSFAMGPGGKGSNQSVASARAGGKVTFISRLGRDAFGENARAMYRDQGITMQISDADVATGAAFIFVSDETGANAVLVTPGAAGEMSKADVDAAKASIKSAAVFLTQLEQPVEIAHYALSIAKGAGATTILNPAPATVLDDAIYKLCDYVTPNESETTLLTGIEVTDVASARKAGDALLKKGVGCALITLGENGVLLHAPQASTHVPVFRVGKVVDTTGAGDAFNGGFATALARGDDPVSAARFGCAVAGISVTRPGTAPSMPHLHEVEALLNSQA
jgi:ribokinase